MIKSKRLLAVGVIAALGLAACGSDDDSSSSTDAPDGTDAMTEGTDAMTEGTDAMSEDGDGENTAFLTLDAECASYDGLQAPADFSVNLVTDIGKVDDGTFNQFASCPFASIASTSRLVEYSLGPRESTAIFTSSLDSSSRWS